MIPFMLRQLWEAYQAENPGTTTTFEQFVDTLILPGEDGTRVFQAWMTKFPDRLPADVPNPRRGDLRYANGRAEEWDGVWRPWLKVQ